MPIVDDTIHQRFIATLYDSQPHNKHAKLNNSSTKLVVSFNATIPFYIHFTKCCFT
eukprot:m.312173 g.312173  ORF g.312173 m.312173 type:complete len:56 (-) comp15966_c1_seq1:180-347(-)